MALKDYNFLQKARILTQELVSDTRDFLIREFEATREMFTVGSAWGQILVVIQSLTQLIMYYIQDSIVELNMQEANRVHSIQGLARLAGHNVSRSKSARGEIDISFTGNPGNGEIEGSYVYLLNYTTVRAIGENGNGLTYTIILNTDEVRLGTKPSDTKSFKVIEGTFETEIRTGTGLPLQSFNVRGRPNQNIENDNVIVKVNGEDWRKYDSIYDIPREENGFLVKTGISGGIDVYFGNGSFGRPPTAGSEIMIQYLVTNGVAGNLTRKENITFKFEDSAFDIRGNEIDLNTFYTAQMRTDFAFGAPAESPDFTRLVAPRTSRSYVLANVTNYIIFFEKLNLFGIVDAWSTQNDDNIEDDNIVYVLLVPDITRFLGSDVDYFTAPREAFILTPQFKARVENLVEESGQRIVTNVLKIIDPIIRRYILNIRLGVFDDADDFLVKSKILEKLSDYFANIRRTQKIPTSDLIDIIESIEGVDWVTVSFLSEQNEAQKAINPDAPVIGLDSDGNISIARGEYPLIRGGWVDRNGVRYEELPSYEVPSSVNIEIRERNPRNYNTDVSQRVKERAAS